MSFIPVYIESREKGEGDEANNLASSLWVLLMVFTAALSVLGIVFMPQVIKLLVSGKGYMSVEGKYELTVTLARMMFSYLFLVTTYGYLMAISQAWKKFFVAALAPAFFNLSVIVFIFMPKNLVLFEGAQLAYGVLVGGVVQVLIVMWQLVRLEQLPKLKWRGFSPKVKTVLTNMLPGMLGLGVLQVMAIVNVLFASRLPEGSHTYIYLADRVLELPQSLIAISLGAALLPTLSELWSKNDKEQMLNTLFDNLGLMLFLALPSAVGMYFLGLPIVQVLFQRGELTEQGAIHIAQVLQIYSVLLLLGSFVKVFVSGFYAIKNTWYPAAAACLTLITHVIIASFLTDAYGLNGLVSATVISAGVNMLSLLIGFYILVEPYSIKKLIAMPIKYLPACLIMGLLLFEAQNYFGPRVEGASFQQMIYLFVSIGLAIVVYFGISGVFKVSEAQAVQRLLMRKILKK